MTTGLEWAATVCGLMSKYLMGSKRVEAWYFSVATHVIFIVICWKREMMGLMPLNFMGLFLALRGLIKWRSE